MRKFGLYTKSGELIKPTKAHTFEEAIEYFSNIKKLNKDDLLSLFDIKETK